MKSLDVLETDPMFRPGIYDGRDLPKLTSEQYHSSSRISRGDLVMLTLPKTALDFIYDRQHQEPPSAAMVRGSALHTAILEPDLFDEEYVLMPMDAKRTKKGDKERIDDFIAQATADGKQVVGWDYRKKQLALTEVTAVVEVSKRVRENPEAMRVLQGPGLTEVSVAWEADGVDKRCRVDRTYYTKHGPVGVDLKSAGGEDGAWAPNFAREMTKRNLQMQAGHYLEGLTVATGEEHKGWLFVVYECKPPFKLYMPPLHPEDIEQGRRQYKRAAELFKRCREADEWPGYVNDYEPVRLLNYAREN